MPNAACSECGKPVASRAKTCGDTCRRARSRRQQRDRLAGREVEKLVGEDAEKAAQEILREQLEPVVREALTEEVLDGIRALVGHIPAAVAEARKQLDSDDEDARAKATALIFKHTFGNKSVVPDITDKGSGELVVNFGIAAPQVRGAVEADLAGEAVELRECDSCHAHKEPDDFEGLSNRCKACYGKMQKAARELVGEHE